LRVPGQVLGIEEERRLAMLRGSGAELFTL
jgi:hypothetical protein